jgi:hypothetical protein
VDKLDPFRLQCLHILTDLFGLVGIGIQKSSTKGCLGNFPPCPYQQMGVTGRK